MNISFCCYETLLGRIITVALDNKRRLVRYLTDLKLLVTLLLIIFDVRHT